MEINWLVYGIECVCFVIAFTGMIMIPLCKNPVWWIHDYPQDIQEKYFETHERVPTKMLSPTVAIKKGCAILFANIKRIRLPGTENMDKEYHQKKYHVLRSLLGMLIGLIPCVLCGIVIGIIK